MLMDRTFMRLSYEKESAIRTFLEYDYSIYYTENEAKSILRPLPELQKGTWHDPFISFYDDITVHLLAYYVMNKVALVKGMIPLHDLIVLKSRCFLLAERKYICNCIKSFKTGMIDINQLNNKFVIILIK